MTRFQFNEVRAEILALDELISFLDPRVEDELMRLEDIGLDRQLVLAKAAVMERKHSHLWPAAKLDILATREPLDWHEMRLAAKTRRTQLLMQLKREEERA